MKFSVKRYGFDKHFIGEGILTVADDGLNIVLSYRDSEIAVEASAMHHPISALENLRKILELQHNSILACNGCRCDTSYRASGGFGTYKIVAKKPATIVLNLFEPTNEIQKLCTVDEHKAAYLNWFFERLM
jgi:hypothetical protein